MGRGSTIAVVKSSYKLLIVLVVVLSGCSPITHVVGARFATIDVRTDSLRIHFRFMRELTSTSFSVNEIRVFQRNRLLCTVHGGHGITEYTFPDVPEGYSITWSEGADSSVPFSKGQPYSFLFLGSDEFIAGTWAYWPQFADPNHRWMFDSLGVYEDRLRVKYQTRVGRDVVYLDFKEAFTIGADTIEVRDRHDSVVGYACHTDPGRPNLMSLELERDLDADEEFTLRIPPSMVGRKDRTLLELRWYVDDGTTIQLVGDIVQSLRM